MGNNWTEFDARVGVREGLAVFAFTISPSGASLTMQFPVV
jgi:hypothetical protein